MNARSGSSAPERAEERIASIDVANYEILAAIREDGCSLCRVQALVERRLIESFLREGRYSPAAREEFVGAGGFCRRHAWQLHRAATEEATGAGIADIYGQLLERDVRRFNQIEDQIRSRRGRRRAVRELGRRLGCPICSSLAGSRESHGYFLAQLLADERAQETYAAGDGLCGTHIEVAIRQALRVDDAGGVARLLLDDAQNRLRELGSLLGEYDRKRDYRFAHERRDEEQRSWTEVIRRYVGERGSNGTATGPEHRPVGASRDWAGSAATKDEPRVPDREQQ